MVVSMIVRNSSGGMSASPAPAAIMAMNPISWPRYGRAKCPTRRTTARSSVLPSTAEASWCIIRNIALDTRRNLQRLRPGWPTGATQPRSLTPRPRPAPPRPAPFFKSVGGN